MDSAAPSAPLRQTLILVNDFVVSTSGYLSRFATRCEDRLDVLSRQIERLETETILLEKKLGSVPGLSAAGAEVPDVQAAAEPAAAQPAANGAPPPTPAPAAAVASAPAPVDPAYEKYFKLVRLGMPVEQVKLKMQSEGFDPAVLDGQGGGGAPAPAPPPPPPQGQPPAQPQAGAAAEGAIVPADGSGDAQGGQLKVKDDPMYAKFFKMINFGVPIPAAKIKMQAEGLDPNILDMDPESPSPNAGTITVS